MESDIIAKWANSFHGLFLRWMISLAQILPTSVLPIISTTCGPLQSRCWKKHSGEIELEFCLRVHIVL